MGPPAVPALVEALQSDSQDVREHAAFALCSIGKPAAPELRHALESKNQAARALAAEVMEEIEAGTETTDD
jgi:HEAT repeat protein